MSFCDTSIELEGEVKEFEKVLNILNLCVPYADQKLYWESLVD
jgi:hypothetical protein